MTFCGQPQNVFSTNYYYIRIYPFNSSFSTESMLDAFDAVAIINSIS